MLAHTHELPSELSYLGEWGGRDRLLSFEAKDGAEFLSRTMVASSSL